MSLFDPLGREARVAPDPVLCVEECLGVPDEEQALHHVGHQAVADPGIQGELVGEPLLQDPVVQGIHADVISLFGQGGVDHPVIFDPLLELAGGVRLVQAPELRSVHLQGDAHVHDFFILVDAFDEEYGVVVQAFIDEVAPFLAHVGGVEHGHLPLGVHVFSGPVHVYDREALPEHCALGIVGMEELRGPGILEPGVLPAELTVVEYPGGDIVLVEDVLEPVCYRGFALGRQAHHNDIEFFILCLCVHRSCISPVETLHKSGLALLENT